MLKKIKNLYKKKIKESKPQPIDILIGSQFGDEGKGKMMDYLANEYDIIARFSGGYNAGHTIFNNDKKVVLHLIPSGIFYKDKINVIGGGVVIDPIGLQEESEEVNKNGGNTFENLLISNKAHLVLPTHKLLDVFYECKKGKSKIGSTLKGIGPTYTDKSARLGLRVIDIFRPDFKQRYEKLRNYHLEILNQTYDTHFEYRYEKEWFEGIEYLKKFQTIDTEYYFYEEKDKKVIAEGAQGTLLDIDHGSYPFVTSSNTVSANAFVGLGIPPNRIGKVYGVFKAYSTRVGNGVFPTELNDEIGELIRKEGKEYGSTTGRDRRCGWLDLPALKYSVILNGVTDLVMTKSDVLECLDKVNVCVSYKIGKNITNRMIFDEEIEPIYEEFEGWRDNKDNLNKYIKFIEDYLKVKITIISNGPNRNDTIKFN